jgi:hypothetical protein
VVWCFKWLVWIAATCAGVFHELLSSITVNNLNALNSAGLVIPLMNFVNSWFLALTFNSAGLVIPLMNFVNYWFLALTFNSAGLVIPLMKSIDIGRFRINALNSAGLVIPLMNFVNYWFLALTFNSAGIFIPFLVGWNSSWS